MDAHSRMGEMAKVVGQMARYIDADFVSGRLREVLHGPKSEFPDNFEQAINCLVYAISILEFAPTADVAPVVHAHWVDNGEPYCSRCEWSPAPEWSYIEDLQLADVYYCPHCGAKMDEVN